MALSLIASVSEGNDLFRNHGNNDKVEGVILFLTLLVLGALVFISSTTTTGRIFSYKWLRIVAAISFSTYIVHLSVIQNTYFLYWPLRGLGEGQSITYLAALAVGLATSLIGGLLFFIAVERPVLLFRDMIVKSWSQND